MIKKATSLKIGNQGPRLDTLHAQKSGQKTIRRAASVARVVGFWMVRYRVDKPGAKRPRKSVVFIRRKCSGMKREGSNAGGRFGCPVCITLDHSKGGGGEGWGGDVRELIRLRM